METKTKPKIVAIGEVLWDIFPTERHLGGAPFNFAVHCHHLGANSAIVSRVGTDELGDEIVRRTQAMGVDHTLIQRDKEHPTGQVWVTLDADGQPSFDICTGVAYDFLTLEPAALERVRGVDIVCFGTLAQRHPVARATIRALLEEATNPLRICDLNLRPPHYTPEIVQDALIRCDVLKLNDQELRDVQEILGQECETENHFLHYLIDKYGIALVCVTLGARGCILQTAHERVEAPGYPCQVVDTVGSGDAFAAALAIGYWAERPLAETADFANLVGAYVATHPGATPTITPEILRQFAAQFGKTVQHIWT